MAKTISAKSDVVSRNGSASDRMPAPALHLARDHEKIGRVARQPVNRRDDDDIAGAKGIHQLAELRAVGGRAGDLLAKDRFAPSGP
jgi:hypothetical protein